MTARFVIITNGYQQQGDRGLPLYEAALRVALAYEMGAKVDARVVDERGYHRALTTKEAEALATAAALEINKEEA